MAELYIPPAPVKKASGRDPKSGRFQKGFIPKVKGKKWDVQRMLGHSDIKTTTIYAISNDEEVKREHEKYLI